MGKTIAEDNTFPIHWTWSKQAGGYLELSAIWTSGTTERCSEHWQRKKKSISNPATSLLIYNGDLPECNTGATMLQTFFINNQYLFEFED